MGAQIPHVRPCEYAPCFQPDVTTGAILLCLLGLECTESLKSSMARRELTTAVSASNFLPVSQLLQDLSRPSAPMSCVRVPGVSVPDVMEIWPCLLQLPTSTSRLGMLMQQPQYHSTAFPRDDRRAGKRCSQRHVLMGQGWACECL